MSKKNRLKQLRKANHYTLDDIEENTGIKRGTYNNYENGKTEPKLKTWQKLADFFAVSVSYLQGIEPDYSKETNKTKEIIIGELNQHHYQDFKNLTLLNSSINNRKKLDKSVNEFLKKSGVVLPKDGNASDKFWLEIFPFLFQDPQLISTVNKFLDKNSNTDEIGVLEQMTGDINTEMALKFETNFGLYFGASNELKKLKDDFANLKHDLLFCKNMDEANNLFDLYISSLKQIQNSLQNKIKNINLKNFAKNKRLEDKVMNEVIHLIESRINDPQMREFYIQADTKGLSESEIEKRQVEFLREYKQKRHEDVSYIDEYLKKYSSSKEK